jgi:hypothetical protein
VVTAIALDILEVFDRKSEEIGDKEICEEREGNTGDGMRRNDRYDAHDQDEHPCERGNKGGEPGILFETKRRSRIERRERLVSKEEEHGGEAHDTREEERKEKADDAVELIFREWDSSDHKGTVGIRETVNGSIVDVVHHYRGKPGTPGSENEGEDSDDWKKFKRHLSFGKVCSEEDTEEEESGMIDKLWEASIPSQSQKMVLPCLVEGVAREDEGEETIDETHLEVKDAPEISQIATEDLFR